MKSNKFGKKIFLTLIIILGISSTLTGATRDFVLNISEGNWELSPNLKTKVWSYNGLVPGSAIIVDVGDELSIKAINNLKVPTSIHWHGLEVPNDQDGTMSDIQPGKSKVYRFKVMVPGTYWYHSHTSPVLEQTDMGLYGALIVKSPEDAKYSSDQIFVLDDWYLGARGERLSGTSRGGMERLGNIETVNGKTGGAIPPVLVQKGELHKFRFINASTAAVHTLKIKVGQFRVTHTDGHPLTSPYLTKTLVINPAERFDVEYQANGEIGSLDEMSSDDVELGMLIPIKFGKNTVAKVASPFIAPLSTAFKGIDSKKADFTLILDSQMSQSKSKDDKMDMGGMMMDHGSGNSPMEWTINGKAFPSTEAINIKVGQIVKIKFINNDTKMMHAMNHPIHLHGVFFQVVSINGKAPERETWKDTISVPAGGSVELAFQYKNPGDWMLHCHILDHEDNGMMTIIKVSK